MKLYSCLKSKNIRLKLGNLEMFSCQLITLQAIPQTFKWKEKMEILKLLFFPSSVTSPTNGSRTVYMAAEAWATLKDTTLAKSWNKLLSSEESITASEELPNSQFCRVDDQGSSDNEEELRDDDKVEKRPSNEEAFHCLETAMKWLDQQEE
ncbi:hypothetical protein LAZ67_3005030 [Cordylochernes scorpioides]|uniref:Uncharacterized protein n=1 Tax=Cordylochernes scorpioides TaxID=51811 RepID=A0ABY6KA05_9ARAC|nr:hypothetical protein LAZ67_3005030 [Cordylochernes scorpioides]